MNGLDKKFNEWWNSDGIAEENAYREGSPVFWAWEGWQAAMKANRKPLMTDEEYEQAMADEGQRRMLEIDTDVRAMIKEAVDAEREACAKICEEPWQGHPYDIAKQIRARGNDAA